MINALLFLPTGDKDPGKNSFWPLALAGLVAGISGSHAGYSGSVPGQGIKISLHATALCCLVEIVLTSPHVVLADTPTLHCSMNTS